MTDTKDGPVEEVKVDEIEGEFDESKLEEKKEEPKISDMTQQQFMSWMGRINAEQVNKGISENMGAIIKELKGSNTTAPGTDDTTDFDSLLTKPKETIRSILNEIRNEDKNLTEQAIGKMNIEIQKHSEDPDFKDIYSDVVKIAKERIGRGFPIKEAVETAKDAARLNLLQGKAVDTEDLGMLEGGRNKGRSKVAKLTPAEEAACVRDINDGVFKTKEEWIKQRNR